MEIEDAAPFQLPPGEYDFIATLAVAGPTTWQIRPLGGTFQDMTDGVITASTDGVIKIAQDFEYQATMESGDTLFISLTDTGV